MTPHKSIRVFSPPADSGAEQRKILEHERQVALVRASLLAGVGPRSKKPAA
jgi:hypothetical protein